MSSRHPGRRPGQAAIGPPPDPAGPQASDGPAVTASNAPCVGPPSQNISSENSQHRGQSVPTPREHPGLALRLQVLGIISGILSGSRPELEGIRARLRHHLDAHPGDPETALLHHLLDCTNHAADYQDSDPGSTEIPSSDHPMTHPEKRELN